MSASAIFTVDGWMPFEDYIARVVTNENGRAPPEALKAQAIAARTYMLRAMRDAPSLGTEAHPVVNSESFQTYAPVANAASAAATSATTGVTANYDGALTLANYVAGALVNADGSLGDDPTNTEKWVTYNEGLTGSDVHPTPLAGARKDNRGCMSQNGAAWLARGGHDAASILRYYYGADLELVGGNDGRKLVLVAGAGLLIAWGLGWI